MEQEESQSPVYDVVIAGAGVAGVLAAVRLAQAYPHARILLVEKSLKAGGRLRTSLQVSGEWNTGLASISEELFQYIDHSLRSQSEGKDLPELIAGRQQKLGLLTGSSLDLMPIADAFTAAGARALAGPPAAREWDKIIDVWASEPAALDQPFSKLWKHPRKNPAAIALSHFAQLCGVADIWSSHGGGLKERSRFLQGGLYFGPWEEVWEALLGPAIAAGTLEMRTSCQILEASWCDKTWHIQTEKGDLTSHTLVVAQPPWQANDWLQRTECPVPVLNLALKAKPTSAVILNEKLPGEAAALLPELTYIAAEGVFAVNSGDGSLSFHATIDFELSLDAPTVVKAIKRLRRASKKLKKAVPELVGEGEYLALRSVAWAQSPAYADRKNWERLGEGGKFQSGHLAFCGDAYGSSYSPDENLMKSLTQACTVVGEHIDARGG